MTFIINTVKNETVNKTIRFPLDLITKIESQIIGKNISFSKFVIQACEYALENIKENTKK
ncbi:MAG: hypothetical protein PHH51_02545 [Bacilli bacterium]|nr:hypothetical protein [Bacilli bacterium]MDD3895927.1 hypothetical protein [Bacilli bacterium]MDD4407958.1 hypothetical protein [Bacilli bacterium]